MKTFVAKSDDWPEGGLEKLLRCPVCGSQKRKLVHAHLRDRMFGCAPGEWNIQECMACGSGYLDPRPTPAAIGLAYKQYLTHSPTGSVDYATASWWRRFRIKQRNGYLNANYGYHLEPAGSSPWLLGAARRRRFDSFTGFFHFPGSGARVLDVGCGNGGFLWKMRSLGWVACGVEPDPKSAGYARAAGLDVRDGLLQPDSWPAGSFDAIMMNHVIEHLHDPLATLACCWQLLKPGGQITVATPNFESRGHRFFGADWLALMPPTHLVLFTETSLRRALETAGFVVSRPPRPSLKAREYFQTCLRLQRGYPMADPAKKLCWRDRLEAEWLAARADRATRQNPAVAEEAVLLGRKSA